MDAVQNLIHREDPCPCGSNIRLGTCKFTSCQTWSEVLYSRKNCCRQFVAGDVFRYMSILIKLSNHLALILPGRSCVKCFSPSLLFYFTTQDRMIHLNRCITHSSSDPSKQKFTPVFTRQHVTEHLPTLCFLVEVSQSMEQPWCSPVIVVNGRYVLIMMQSLRNLEWPCVPQTLEILLHEWSKDSLNKVLIFTKSVKLLDMLDFHLKAQGMILRLTWTSLILICPPGYGFVKLEGSTKQSDRQPSIFDQWTPLQITVSLGMPMIDKFQKDPKVFIFLISTLAGGTGLNLTGDVPSYLTNASEFDDNLWLLSRCQQGCHFW